MTYLIYITQAFAAALVLRAFANRNRLLHYPTMFSVVYGFWFLPQIHKLADCVTCGDVEITYYFSLACFLAVILPWELRLKPAHRPPKPLRFSEPTLCVFLVIYAIVGFASYLGVHGLESSGADISINGQWTGRITILWFFSQLLFISAVFSFILFAKTKRSIYAVIAALAFALLIYRGVFLGRRAAVLDLVLYGSLLCYFVYGLKPKGMFIAAAAPFILVFIVFVGEYRVILDQASPIEAARAIFDSGAFTSALSRSTSGVTDLEALNAVSIIDAMRANGDYSFLSTLWNSIVHRYVPAQLLGADFKASLQIQQVNVYDAVVENGGSFAAFGATNTGIASAFVSLSYLGFIWFFVISLIMKWLFKSAVRGSAFSQALYVYMANFSLHALTHDHYWFFTPLIQFFVFFGFAYVASAYLRTYRGNLK